MPLVGKLSTSIKGKFFPPYEPSKYFSSKNPLPRPPCQINDLAGNPGTPSRKRWEKKRGKPPCLPFLNASIISSAVIPECFYQESKLFEGKCIWMPDKRF